jgi:hypothetical protein
MNASALLRLPVEGEEIQPQEGLRAWRNAGNGFLVVQIHYTASAARRGDWKYRAAPKYGGLKSWRWRKEMEIDWEAQSGALVFEAWDPRVHHIQPFTIPEHWPRWLLIDPGWRNPTAMDWMAVDTDTPPNAFGFRPVHIYREFYRPKHSAEFIATVASEWSRTVLDDRGRPDWEWVEAIVLDPMAKQEHQSAADGEDVNAVAETFLSKFEAKILELGWTVQVETGNNLKDAAIEETIARLGCFWIGPDGLPLYDETNQFRDPTLVEIAAGAEKILPTLFFHRSVVDGAREMAKYRWRDWAASEVRGRHNEQERPVDKDDHAITNLIRGVNLLRAARVEGEPDLSALDRRDRPRPWRPDEEVLETHHRRLAGRHRKRLRRKDDPR